MFFRWLLRKIKFYLKILKALLIGLAITSVIAIVFSLFVIFFYDPLLCLLLLATVLDSIITLNTLLYEMRFLPSRYLLAPINITFNIAMLFVLSPYIPLLINALFWPSIITVALVVFAIGIYGYFLIYKPLTQLKDNYFDDLQMPMQEEKQLIRTQETALAALKKYDLSANTLQPKERALIDIMRIIEERLAPNTPEGIEDIITGETFKVANKPFILLFKEYQVNDNHWVSYSDRGSNIHAFTQESMKGYYHPKTGASGSNHPINNGEKIFEPDKRPNISREGIETKQYTRYRFHTYQLLADGKTPLCLELCTRTEELLALLQAPGRNALKLPEATSLPSPHIQRSMYRSTVDKSEEKAPSCWKLCFN